MHINPMIFNASVAEEAFSVKIFVYLDLRLRNQPHVVGGDTAFFTHRDLSATLHTPVNPA
jgi:hypothetical protein